MSRKVYIIVLVAVTMILSGCRRHKYYDLEHTYGSLQIVFDWDGYIDIPPGMNLMFYPLTDTDDDVEARPILQQLQYDGGKVSLPIGKYDVLVYNDYTYNILYRGMDNFMTAEAYLNGYDRLPLSRTNVSVRSFTEPDIFYVAQIRGLEVNGCEQKVIVRPELKTLKLFVHVGVDGMQYVSQADGSITGAASNVMLSTGLTSDIVAGKRVFGFSINKEELYGETKMFLCNAPLTERYELELAFLLRNNSVSVGKFKYDVSSQIIDQLHKNNGKLPPEGIHIYIGDVQVDKVSGDGFDAVVDSWGNEVDIELK